MSLFRFLLLCLLFQPAWPAAAADLAVQVSSGKATEGAVVSLHIIGRPTPVPKPRGSYAVSQRNIQFHPFVSLVPVGAIVSFPNFDTVRHHVYSFSPAKLFELKLYAKDQTRTMQFDQAGTVALGCNIHDSMSAFIFVTDTIWSSLTDHGGNVLFRDLPRGRYSIEVWHPYLRGAGNRVSREIDVTAADQHIAIPVTLRAPPMHNMSGY